MDKHIELTLLKLKPKMMNLAKRRFPTFDSDDYEEMFQLTHINVWKNISKLKDPKAMNIWMFSIFINEGKRLYKTRGKFDEFDNFDIISNETPETMLINNETEKVHLKVTDMVSKLSKRQQQAIKLHYLDELTYPEVAKKMGLTMDGAKANGYIGISSLRETVASKKWDFDLIESSCTILNIIDSEEQ